MRPVLQPFKNRGTGWERRKDTQGDIEGAVKKQREREPSLPFVSPSYLPLVSLSVPQLHLEIQVEAEGNLGVLFMGGRKTKMVVHGLTVASQNNPCQEGNMCGVEGGGDLTVRQGNRAAVL